MQNWRTPYLLKISPSAPAKTLTREELAFEAKINLTCAVGIERGKQSPSLLVLAGSKALSVPLSTLLTE
jgi:hypothetical protein